jgi:membrane protein DedA with SNARE-associated domain
LEAIGHFIHLITTVEGISEIIRFGGLLLLVLIVFAETGLLVGFFLPGDSLLVTAGFLAATTDVLHIWPVHRRDFGGIQPVIPSERRPGGR